MLQKKFPGGMLTMVGSNSPSGLASTPCKYVLGDERDRWALSAGTEGDPWKLAEARTTTFYNAKMVEVSTPTIKGASAIEKGYNAGTRERWCHQCPDCGEWVELCFDDFKFQFETIKQDRNKKDFFITETGFIFNEINTIPGFTPISMYPKMMIHSGMTYAGLIDRMLSATFA